MEKETKLFVVIFIVLLVSVFSCWILGQQQESPEFEQQSIGVCDKSITTTIMMTMTGYTYMEGSTYLSIPKTITGSQVITLKSCKKLYFPLIMKNAK